MRPKKKSKLQKKIEDPTSRYWKLKADKLWKLIVTHLGGGKCTICSGTEFVQAHHILPREMYSHRHDVRNAILLCCSHHKYSFEISPHKAPVEFFKWLIKIHPDLWEWLTSQAPTRKNSITFKEVVDNLTAQYKDIIEMEEKQCAAEKDKSNQ